MTENDLRAAKELEHRLTRFGRVTTCEIFEENLFVFIADFRNTIINVASVNNTIARFVEQYLGNRFPVVDSVSVTAKGGFRIILKSKQ